MSKKQGKAITTEQSMMLEIDSRFKQSKSVRHDDQRKKRRGSRAFCRRAKFFVQTMIDKSPFAA